MLSYLKNITRLRTIKRRLEEADSYTQRRIAEQRYLHVTVDLAIAAFWQTVAARHELDATASPEDPQFEQLAELVARTWVADAPRPAGTFETYMDNGVRVRVRRA